MLSFLHNYLPSPVLLNLGFFSLRWYGVLITIAIASAIAMMVRIGKKAGMKDDDIIDVSIATTIGGIIGARLYEILIIEPAYYFQNPLRMLKIWEGGLAIHGGLIGGAIALWLYCHYKGLSLIKMAASAVTGVALGQAIGRLGNWFNQELYGSPTILPWGIPIAPENRLPGYQDNSFYHPVFLYESLGCLLISWLLWKLAKHYHFNFTQKAGLTMILSYLALYSLLRFSLEFIKIDPTFMLGRYRWPQLLSLLIFLVSVTIIYWKHCQQRSKPL
ncbi:MAG: prolipoprotein diacylglyceryl transferase [Bacillota bacterium]